jgi:hypothetical protein
LPAVAVALSVLPRSSVAVKALVVLPVVPVKVPPSTLHAQVIPAEAAFPPVVPTVITPVSRSSSVSVTSPVSVIAPTVRLFVLTLPEISKSECEITTGLPLFATVNAVLWAGRAVRPPPNVGPL